ncbi:MAG TPA: hypothetical protein VKE95_13185 [Burkholderiales bacterium]|nr:hypothetical protein [Burkholderiales bacterium]
MPLPKKLAVLPLLLLAAACTATYFKVTDLDTGREYYTGDFTQKDGAIRFKDARTGATTTVQNPRVLEIDQRTFESGVAAPSAPSSK